MSRTTIEMTENLNNYMISVCGEVPEVNLRLRAETARLSNSVMQISTEQGRFMGLLIKLMNAKKTLEIGTFTGYSALVTAQALPEDGKLIACDVSAEWTSIGKKHWVEAGVAHKIDLRIAPALETLNDLIATGHIGTFDFAFIDADKSNYVAYYEKAMQLLRPGGLIGVDNTLWYGKVADDSVQDEDTVAIRAINKLMSEDTRVHVSVVPIGDGLTLAWKK